MNNTDTDGQMAWDLHNAISKNEQKRRVLFLENMKIINNLYRSKLYTAILGDEEAPWTAYLGQHEIFYSASKVYTMNKIYQRFIKELKLTPEQIVDIPTTKLASLLPIVNKENVEEWLIKAQELTNQDFMDEIRVAQGKVSYTDCPHNEETNYKICTSCGFRHKI